MCGIFGIVSPTSDTPLLSEDLSTTAIDHAFGQTKHRGPDASNLTWLSSNATVRTASPLNTAANTSEQPFGVLGHHRLSIIDLSEHASQPMVDTQQRYVLTFNGEIYNYKALKKECEAHPTPWVFQSDSDSDVLLALYHYYRDDIPTFLNKLNGMFAFAIFDRERNKLVCARDRLGIKPFYYSTLNDNTFAFASEVKSLVTLPTCKRQINKIALLEHFTFQNTFGEKTLLEDIHLLSAGHYIEHDLNTGLQKKDQYWQATPSIDSKKDTGTFAQELSETISDAVQSQLMSDVPVGSFLSGGMDTGAITALGAKGWHEDKTHSDPFHTFTVGFELEDITNDLESHFDEREDARAMAEIFKTTHHETLITKNQMPELLSKTVWHLDDFRAGISYQNLVASQLASDSVTVTLSGVGGDELFGGYPWRYATILNETGKQFDAYFSWWNRLLTDDEKKKLFTPEISNMFNHWSSRDSFDEILSNLPETESPLETALLFELNTFLHGLLVVEDRLSMAHHLESRVPLLDNTVIDLALTMPASIKYNREGETQASSGKWILKEALKSFLPNEVINRRKQGFTPPDATWFRQHHKGFIEGMLLSKKTLDRGWFNPSELRRILDEHESGKKNHRFLIWSLLCFEQWQHHFLD